MSKELKILILEDNESDADLLQYEIKKSGLNFTALVVRTQEEYEHALPSFVPGIILSDYSLPSFNGMKAYFLKQDQYPDIPFIIVSGTIGEENAVELIKSGVTDYLLKDKLFALAPKITRALKEAAEKKENIIADQKLKTQYKQLLDIASMQSHQVRAPVASILGLINLINFDDASDPRNAEVLGNLKKATLLFDNAIREIVQTTASVRRNLEE